MIRLILYLNIVPPNFLINFKVIIYKSFNHVLIKDFKIKIAELCKGTPLDP